MGLNSLQVDDGVVESPGQSPFGLWVVHPGEWGLVETDLDAEIERNNREEQKIREEQKSEDVTAAARENTDTLRYRANIRPMAEWETCFFFFLSEGRTVTLHECPANLTANDLKYTYWCLGFERRPNLKISFLDKRFPSSWLPRRS